MQRLNLSHLFYISDVITNHNQLQRFNYEFEFQIQINH